MNKLYTLLILLFIVFKANAQTQPYGIIDTADLKLTSCDFEKDANAEVLFDKAYVYYKYSTVVMEHHKRIKIFNDKGNEATKVRIEFYGAHKDEVVSDLEAETVNISNNTIQYTPVDKSIIYTQDVDKEIKAIVFTFPNIKPGSIVEFKYKWSSPYAGNFPDWFFQENIPIRYSEFKADFSKDYTFKTIDRVHQKFATDTTYFTNGKNINHGQSHMWALSDVHSVKQEPFMTSISDNTQRILFQVTGYSERTWYDITKALLANIDFGNELDTRILLSKQGEIIDKINSLPTADQKIAYVYNLVKGTMKYNGRSSIFTHSEIKSAWSRKEGNAAEMNFIIYNFLKKSGMDVSLLLLNTNHKIEDNYATIQQFNRVVVYFRSDSAKQYVLDAANKDGKYNQIPYYLLNSNALVITPPRVGSAFITLENLTPLQKTVAINAEITPDGKMSGTTQINCSEYVKTEVTKEYKDDGEKKYIDYLQNNNNSLKISSVKIDNMDVDSLPLTQNIDFKLDLVGSDENYIYFSPNLFSGLNSNPFLSEERFSDIDFKFLNALTISGRYKIPAGFKIDALPKSVMVLMPDRSIVFKRIVAEDDGYVAVHYTINFGRSYYLKDEYSLLRDFYQKMYQMLNEQIILKKT